MRSHIDTLHSCFAIVHGAVNNALGLQKGRKNDLSLISVSILRASCDRKVRMNDVSDLFDVRLSTASGCVDNLEAKGLVTRVRSEGDKRIVYIEPTEAGRIWMREREEKLEGYIEKCMGKLTKDDQEAFVRLFSRFVGLDDHSYHSLLAELYVDTPPE